MGSNGTAMSSNDIVMDRNRIVGHDNWNVLGENGIVFVRDRRTDASNAIAKRWRAVR